MGLDPASLLVHPVAMSTTNRIIPLSAGRTDIEIWTIGARMNAVFWAGSDSLLDGAATPEEAIGGKLNHGCVVGPVANRIAGSSFDLEGVTYSFPPNEGTDTFLHSGDNSLRDRLWDIESQSATEATLVADLGDMEDGFPGKRRFEARYSVVEDGFDLTFSASTDAPTLVNLALHPYWRLDRKGREGLRMAVKADRYLPIDDKKIPTGEIAPVDGTIFDLRELGIPSTSIDHSFCLEAGDATVPSATLASERIRLDILTDAPGLQVFTGQTFGIAIEPQHWPDTPHHPAFPPIRLDPGQAYSQTTRYRFKDV